MNQTIKIQNGNVPFGTIANVKIHHNPYPKNVRAKPPITVNFLPIFEAKMPPIANQTTEPTPPIMVLIIFELVSAPK